ncbi:MAG: MOSC domain-containing protein [Merismopedia sp. SIO2A8]|nr:MOSC domain-containing protein [Merismopedia sp. SIO2A8]
MTLSGIHIYPIKSAAGITLQSATVQARGLEFDRRWMVVDRSNRFMTQRKFPKMALIQVHLNSDTLAVSAPDIDPLILPLQPTDNEDSGAHLTVDVWGDRCDAISMGAESNAWFSQVIGQDCQLVYMPDNSQRPTDHGKYGNEQSVSFADAYPFLLISEASLEDLNGRLEAPIPMNRFRPNLVVKGCDAFAEDDWNQIQIGKFTFSVAKACSRCTIPTVDQVTGIRGKEPITTLATYRRWEGKIWFGQNLIQVEDASAKNSNLEDGKLEDSQLTVGDRLTIIS